MTHEEKIRRYENAKMLAIRMHGIQEYDGFPYHKHLQDVEDVLLKFGYDKYGIHVVCAWLHDILEDCPVSYNDLMKEFGYDIAEIVFCVTDELGRNRKERKHKTYPKIKSNPDAIVIKLADRIANVTQGLKHGNKLADMYKKEYEEFKAQLYIPNLDNTTEQMWNHLERMIFTEKEKV